MLLERRMVIDDLREKLNRERVRRVAIVARLNELGRELLAVLRRIAELQRIIDAARRHQT